MTTVSTVDQQIKKLQILYNNYKDFYILFSQIRSKSALLLLNETSDAYKKLLEETKQEVNSRQK